GLGTVVERDHPQSGVNLTYIGTGTGEAGDKYVGLDRFGRVVDQLWTTGSTVKDEFQYGYDRDSNATTRTNALNSNLNESYGYDGLNRLTNFARGSHTQSFNLDAQGNFSSITTESTTQTRTHNQQNQITSISGATTPTYDNNGNLTKDETGR